MSRDTKIKLKIDLGDDGGGIHIFRTVGELCDWIKFEHEEWKWLNDAARYINSEIGGVFNNAFNVLSENIQEMVSDVTVEEGQIESFKEKITNLLKSKFDIINSDRIIYSKSPKGRFIHQLANENPYEAAAALLYLTDKEILTHNKKKRTVNEISGMAKAVLFNSGIFGKKKAAQESFGLFLKKWDVQFGNQHEESATLIENLEVQKSATEEFEGERKKYFIDQKEECVKLNTKYNESCDEAIDKLKNELQAMRNAVDSDLRLRQPTDYWKRKSEDHAKLTIKYQNWAIVVGILGFMVLALTGIIFLPTLDEGIPWRSLAFIILLASIYIYGLRIIIRMFFSNHHLMNDAEERVVMIRTYMSLVRGDDKGGFLTKEQLPIVLAALFRPAQKGLVDEPNMPVMPLEIANQAVQRFTK